MHPRSSTWFPAPAVVASRSDDGWIRVRLSLPEETDATSAPPGAPPAAGSVPPPQSWALDPAVDRIWEPLEAAVSPADPAQTTTRASSHDHGNVEGIINPQEDSRGLTPERVGLTEVRVVIPGRMGSIPGGSDGGDVDADAAGSSANELVLRVGRCRDGLRVDLALQNDEAIYGLGERTGTLDKRGATWAFWNTDDPLHTPDKDPLYQSIPVAYLHTSGGTRTVFADCPATQYFDAGESDPDALRIEAYDHTLDLYLRTDDSLPAAVRAYAGLTGRSPLPPEWALGFQQCRYSYFPEARVLEVAAEMRERRVPCDVIYLDIHYMDGYRVFTWHPERFPDPEGMIRSLHDQGFRVVTIVDPGVKVDADYRVSAEAIARGLTIRNPDGSPYVGKVWPGDATFPDFSRAETRSWWAGHHRALLGRGVDGIWNDMNEPADFTGDSDFRPRFTPPEGVVAGDPDAPVPFARVHNLYANGMAMGTREGFAAHQPESRGFVLTRAGYAGIQRTAAVWTGDNHSWWAHLAMQIPMMLNLSLSGVPFCGADTGGFQAKATPELYARWVESACLLPFFRAHSARNTADHEPWSFGEQVLAIARKHIELRYRLLPYLYTLFETASRTGDPVVRPLLWEFPGDPALRDRADSFMLGSALLVAPVREPGVTDRSVYLPSGTWYDLWTGERLAGGRAIVADAPLDRLPLYVRAGSIVPLEAVRQTTADTGDGVLTLLVAPDDDAASGTLYADAGDGFGYTSGEFWRADLTYAGGKVAITTAGGSVLGRWSRVRARFVGAGMEGVTEPAGDRDATAELAGSGPVRVAISGQ